MNIFVLDKDPCLAAIYQCDKHVVKMVLETAQLLCTAFPADKAPYKRTHYNHPCAVWTRQSFANFKWLLDHGIFLAAQYRFRYDRQHKSKEVIDWVYNNWDKYTNFNGFIKPGDLTPFVQCMPDQYKISDNPIQAYRNYYIGEKAKFAKWTRKGAAPSWWPND